MPFPAASRAMRLDFLLSPSRSHSPVTPFDDCSSSPDLVWTSSPPASSIFRPVRTPGFESSPYPQANDPIIASSPTRDLRPHRDPQQHLTHNIWVNRPSQFVKPAYSSRRASSSDGVPPLISDVDPSEWSEDVDVDILAEDDDYRHSPPALRHSAHAKTIHRHHLQPANIGYLESDTRSEHPVILPPKQSHTVVEDDIASALLDLHRAPRFSSNRWSLTNILNPVASFYPEPSVATGTRPPDISPNVTLMDLEPPEIPRPHTEQESEVREAALEVAIDTTSYVTDELHQVLSSNASSFEFMAVTSAPSPEKSLPPANPGYIKDEPQKPSSLSGTSTPLVTVHLSEDVETFFAEAVDSMQVQVEDPFRFPSSMRSPILASSHASEELAAPYSSTKPSEAESMLPFVSNENLADQLVGRAQTETIFDSPLSPLSSRSQSPLLESIAAGSLPVRLPSETVSRGASPVSILATTSRNGKEREIDQPMVVESSPQGVLHQQAIGEIGKSKKRKRKETSPLEDGDCASTRSSSPTPERRMGKHTSRKKRKWVIDDSSDSVSTTSSLSDPPSPPGATMPPPNNRRVISPLEDTGSPLSQESETEEAHASSTVNVKISSSDSSSTPEDSESRRSDLPDNELRGFLIEAMASSRVSSMPASVLHREIMRCHKDTLDRDYAGLNKKAWISLLLDVLDSSDVFGRLDRGGKNAIDKKHEPHWYYVPEKDDDRERATLIASMKPQKRSEARKYKQYYYRPVAKMSRWDDEEDA